MRRPLVAGNWKMNGLVEASRDLVNGILAGLSKRGELRCEVVVCPPFTGLSSVNKLVTGSSVKLGGQNMSEFGPGAHTGEISGTMLRDIGCQCVILGHSERRADNGEDSAMVGRKMVAAFRDGLAPIVCVGETLEQREQGKTLEVVKGQLMAVLPLLPEDQGQAQTLVIAYEPVWAIGTGKVATPAQVQEVHASIRQLLVDQKGSEFAGKVRILYGGSVKPDNAKELFALEDVDGGLIGGAAMKAADFLAIIDAAS